MTLDVNDRFERATIGFMHPDHFDQTISNRDQARRRLQRSRIMNRSKIERASRAVICVDNRHPSVPKGGVDGQDSHRLIYDSRSFVQDGIEKTAAALILAEKFDI